MFLFFGLFLVELITLLNDKKLLMWNNYTYSISTQSKNGDTRWKCSSQFSGCRAFIYTTNNMDILRMDSNHIHQPPKYVQMKNGKYMKI